MTNLTTSNLQPELQKLFDNSGGIFYKADSKDPILIVEPESKTKQYTSERILTHSIIAVIIFIFIINLSGIINYYLFINPTMIHGLKLGAKYNIAPIFMIFLVHTLIVSGLWILSGIKVDNIYFLWAGFYIILQLYLLISLHFQYENKLIYNYNFLSYNISSIIGFKKGNYSYFLFKLFIIVLGFSAILIYNLNDSLLYSTDNNVKEIIMWVIMGSLSVGGLFLFMS